MIEHGANGRDPYELEMAALSARWPSWVVAGMSAFDP
jgi:hypothetical protein